MQDSLISRKALLEDMKNSITENSDTFDWINLINKQSTAYDVDKVVERLEENGHKMSEAKSNTPYGKSTPGCHNYYKAISVKRAIKIVKGGGVDE